MTARDTATKLQSDFESLMGNYKRMTKMLLDGLAPGVPQKDRNDLIKLFTPFVEAPAGKEKSAVERGGTLLE